MELSSPSSSSFSLFSEINNGKSTIDLDDETNNHELSTADSIPNDPDHHHHLNSENPNKNNQIPKSDSSIDSSNRVASKKNKKVSVPSSSSSTSHKGGFRMVNKRRIVDFGGGKSRAESFFDSLALPLGMSFAAVVAQVLDKKTTAGERIEADHLSQICTEALKEALAKVYGNRFDSFVRNFETSFETTLRTLRMIDTTFSEKVKDPLVHSRINDYISEVAQPALSEEQGHPLSRSSVRSHHSDVVPSTCGVHEPSFSSFEERNDESSNDLINQDLILHRQINQQFSVSQNSLVSHRSGNNQYMLSTFEKSVEEHARSNDLRSFEIGLKMKELKLKEEKLSLSYDSNRLEKCKLSMGISKATFRAEKFKTQLEDTKHAELLKKCIDCLVAGLFIMSACLMYGAYIYSYQRITEITASCTTPPKESTSWWMPKQVSSLNSGLHTLRCQIEVVSRMMFGILMILVIGYLLLQRSSSSKQTMPITIIVMLLAVACGFVGKFCVDTLGGSGFLWLFHWEVLCMVHFFANICTSALFILLYGPVPVSAGTNINTKPPYWIRRFLFYVVILSLPVLCGLMPFAGPGEWIDHFFSRVRDALFGPEEVWE